MNQPEDAGTGNDAPSPQPAPEDLSLSRLQISNRYEEGVFCEKCKPVLDHLQRICRRAEQVKDARKLDDNLFGDIPHWATISLLKASAARGCQLCSLAEGSAWLKEFTLGSKLSGPEDDSFQGTKDVHLFKETPGVTGPADSYCHIQFFGLWSECFLRMAPPKSLFFSAEDYFASEKKPENLSSQSTGDPEALNLAQWWLQRCLRDHKLCGDSGQALQSDFPARLLFVGTHPQDTSLRLHINQDSATVLRQQYLTLSYCWGKRPFPRLTLENLKTMTDRIDISNLPATLQDAIKVTRWLGYHYLWIDALCIIQDSAADWETESVKMGGVYRNSAMTIAALGAPDCYTGCFLDRNPLRLRHCQVPGSRFEITPIWDTPETDWYGERAATLNTRAWTVQERILSRRTLYFGATGLFWDCIECDATESNVLGKHHNQQETFKKAIHLELTPTKKFDGQRLTTFFRLWQVVLFQYSSSRLTYASDKLVAISGIANLLAKANNLAYSLGLWLEWLLPELFWHSSGPNSADDDRGTRLDNGVPSWSWASIDKAVSLGQGRHAMEWDAELIAIVVPPPTAPPSRVKELLSDCKLVLDTQLKKVQLLPSDGLSGWPRIAFDGDKRMRGLQPMTYDWQPDIKVDAERTEAWYICVARFKSEDETKVGGAGFVVIPKDSAMKEWVRIGYAEHSVFLDPKHCRDSVALGKGKLVKDGRFLLPNPLISDAGAQRTRVTIV